MRKEEKINLKMQIKKIKKETSNLSIPLHDDDIATHPYTGIDVYFQLGPVSRVLHLQIPAMLVWAIVLVQEACLIDGLNPSSHRQYPKT